MGRGNNATRAAQLPAKRGPYRGRSHRKAAAPGVGSGSSAAADVVRLDHYSQALHYRDRRLDLEAKWWAEADWLPDWREVVAFADRQTAPWPARVAEAGAAIAPDDAMHIDPLAPLDRERLVLYPLLDEFAEAYAAAFGGAPPEPAPDPAPPEPATVEDARNLLREERTAFRAVRSRLRRGRLRGDVVAALEASLSAWPRAWLTWSRCDLTDLVWSAAAREQIRAAAEEQRRARLSALATLDGFLTDEGGTRR